jgi:tetratricopeptide (TPR) repeat protein
LSRPKRKRVVKDKVFPAILFVLLAVVTIGVPGQTRPDALVLYREGQFERAVEITLEELQENPRNLDSYTVLGWSLLALRRYEDAVDYGSRGLEVSRFDHRLVHIVGEAHYQLGNYTEALQYLQNYAALAPQGALLDEVYFLIGEIHIQFEEYHHADIAMTTALHLDDSRARWWARLGYAREMAGSPEYARQAYEAALQRSPNLIEARRGIERLDS